MKKLILFISVLLSFSLSACAKEEKKAQNSDKLQITTTFYPMYEFTKEVVGDVGEVSLLIPAGTEPHDYEPSAKDMVKISESDAFIYNSPEMETWITDIKDSVNNKKVFVEAAKNISLSQSSTEEPEEEKDESDKEEHEHTLDPHVWLDPVLAKEEVATIAKSLSALYPEHEKVFTENSERYIEKLSALDNEYSKGLKEATQRTFVTQHAAFSYLAKRYNLTQESVSGLTPDEEPSPTRLAELNHFVKDHGIEVIYFEENATTKVAETLVKETGVKSSVLNTLESLSQADMNRGKNYLSVMEENLAHLKLSIK